MALRARSSLFFAAALTASAIFAACGSDDNSVFGDGKDGGGDDGAITDGSQSFPEGGGFNTDSGGTPTGPISITPADQVIDIPAGASIPTVTYQAIQGGKAVKALWSIDRGELGSIDVGSGVFKPSGTVGGKTNITATVGSVTVATSVTVSLHFAQNGGGADDDAGTVPGAGGFGGVGGFGVGGAVTDPSVFPGTPTADASLKVLYPYDGTVWPRGILPPLLQWTGDKAWDGLYIHLKETTYEWSGTFSKPGLAPTFVDHPIPVDVWKQLTQSNQGEDVTVTIELTAGGAVFGPVTETWKIASAPLKGTVYYQSYGTLLATNFGGAKPDNHRFGAATLGIHPGDTAPLLVAGKTTTDNTGCRVCHSVSADGSQLVTKWADDVTTSTYDLHGTPGSNETQAGTHNLAWPAVAPNGAYVFTDSSNAVGSVTDPSTLNWIPSGNTMTATSLPAGLRAAFPAFSSDGKHVAFTWYGGAVTGFGTGDTNTLAVMDFVGPTGFEDAGGGGTFSNFTPLFNPAATDAGVAGLRAIYPSYLPTNDAIVFENETQTNAPRLTGTQNYGETRASCDDMTIACGKTGSQGELWWIDVKTKTAHRLDKLNGGTYLPDGVLHTGAADAKLNYEPTVNPVPSGGYAWVVFTSRRMYGNVATRQAYDSDPRYADLTTSPTPKKLWVAAIDLNAPPGTDPSHPAFYLPAQELFAGNARGYWVVDPCENDGTSCETGDECCGGYCRPGGDAGGLICTNVKPTCAQEFEKCATTADCCDKANGVACIDGRCGKSAPR